MFYSLWFWVLDSARQGRTHILAPGLLTFYTLARSSLCVCVGGRGDCVCAVCGAVFRMGFEPCNLLPGLLPSSRVFTSEDAFLHTLHMQSEEAFTHTQTPHTLTHTQRHRPICDTSILSPVITRLASTPQHPTSPQPPMAASAAQAGP